MNRYAVTQKQIDGILSSELKGIMFTAKPIFNPRIYNNGQVKAEIYPWGNMKSIKIGIGKQDSPKREFLIDTLLHEELEARIITRKSPYYQKLNASDDFERHNYINRVIKGILYLKDG